MAALSPTAPSGIQLWWGASRPRTLALAVAPVLVGTAVAYSEGQARLAPALAALFGALLLQVASNLANDVFDFEKGADTAARIGPPRATERGWVTPVQMRRAVVLVLCAATLPGVYLVSVAGWPVLAVGLLSVAAALAYTGGPWPLGYHGLGEAAVFLFFGVVAVMGSDYVQSLSLSLRGLLASLPVGALASATLVVNNLRDIEQDRVAGKRTLAVFFGRRGARIEYLLLIAFAYAAALLLWLLAWGSEWLLLCFATLPIALRLLQDLWCSNEAAVLNRTLAGTARLGLVFSFALAIGLAW